MENKIKSYALRLLTIKSRTRKELKEKLQRKGYYNEEDIEKTLDNLERVGLINDREYAKSWVRNRLQNRPIGKSMLSIELKRKGIDSGVIEEIVEQENINEIELIENLLRKKVKSIKKSLYIKKSNIVNVAAIIE